MRLQLITLLLLTSYARAGGEAGLRLDAYDDGWVRSILPSVDAGWQAPGWGLRADYGIDLISGATPITVDAVTSATHFSDRRHQATLAVNGLPTPELRLGGAYTTSHERDYHSHRPSLRMDVELLDRTATLGIAYAVEIDRIGMATDPTFSAREIGHALDLSWTQILGPRTVLGLQASGGWLDCEGDIGCRASPYRYVGLFSPDGAVLQLPERNPDQLGRGAIALRISQAIGDHAGLHGSYRFYADSWKVLGHAAEASAAVSALDDRLGLRANARYSNQGAASFFRTDYLTDTSFSTAPLYRTADRELSGLNAWEVGGRVEWSFHGLGPLLRLSLSARISHLWFHYPQFVEMPRREAWIGGGGLRATF